MISLRRTALIWMTLLLTLVGAATAFIVYRFEINEFSEFLDGQQRQIALNAGEGLRKGVSTPVDEDFEDQFSVTIWNADDQITHATMPEVQIPLQSKQGFSNISVGGQRWRVYVATDGFKTIQVAQRSTVREDLAAGAAIGVAAPLLIVIPLSWIVIGWAMNRILGRLDSLAGPARTSQLHLTVFPRRSCPL